MESDTRIIDETRKVPQTHEMEWCCGTFYDIMIPNKKTEKSRVLMLPEKKVLLMK